MSFPSLYSPTRFVSPYPYSTLRKSFVVLQTPTPPVLLPSLWKVHSSWSELYVSQHVYCLYNESRCTSFASRLSGPDPTTTGPDSDVLLVTFPPQFKLLYHLYLSCSGLLENLILYPFPTVDSKKSLKNRRDWKGRVYCNELWGPKTFEKDKEITPPWRDEEEDQYSFCLYWKPFFK